MIFGEKKREERTLRKRYGTTRENNQRRGEKRVPKMIQYMIDINAASESPECDCMTRDIQTSTIMTL